jgi:hypothetical protein
MEVRLRVVEAKSSSNVPPRSAHPIPLRESSRWEEWMYHHIKKLMYTVNVGTPNVRFGNMLLEQFGGANGELAAALQ